MSEQVRERRHAQVHDLGSMKRDEHIAAVLAKEGGKATVRKGQNTGKKQTGTQKAGRYDGMKRQIASQKKSGTKATASKGKAPSRPRAKGSPAVSSTVLTSFLWAMRIRRR